MIKQILVVLSFLTVIAVNAMASLLPLNNLTTGEITNSFSSFFVPANWTFSIWGIIYFGLFFFVLYQSFPAYKNDPVFDRIRPLFVGSCLANAGWVFFWHYLFVPGSMVMMLVLFGMLMGMYLILKKEKEFSKDSVRKWLVMIPLSMYLAWICVATLLNFTVLLIDMNIVNVIIPGEIWSLLMIIVATVFGLVFGVKYDDNLFIYVFIWALVGLAVKFAFISVIALTACAGCIVLLAGAFDNWYRRHPRLFRRMGDHDLGRKKKK